MNSVNKKFTTNTRVVKDLLTKYRDTFHALRECKTENYIGLICKDTDAGFGLIIVLAGIHNNLRSQTQIRIDESFLGFDTQHTGAFDQRSMQIGVGDPYFGSPIVAHSLTSSIEKGDFTQGAANALGLKLNTSEPIVAVIKKNPHVLRRIYQW